MKKELVFLTVPEELVEWVSTIYPDIQITRAGAKILLDFMDEHDYRIGLDENKQLVRLDLSKDTERIEEYSLDDMIETVAEWNYEVLMESELKLRNATNLIDLVNGQIRCEYLKRQDEILEDLFAQTKHGKELDQLAYRLAETLVSGAEAEEPEECILFAVEMTNKKSTDKERGR